MKKSYYSPGKPDNLNFINFLKNNKELKHGSSLSNYTSNKTSNRNSNSKYNMKERPFSHKTINSIMSKKSKTAIQKQQFQYQSQPISVKNNNNEINIHLSIGSDSINNNSNNYSNNTNYSKITNSYEDILKEKDIKIQKLEKELSSYKKIINQIKSNHNLNINGFISNSNNLASLSKNKSSGNITTKKKAKNESQNFFNSILKNTYNKHNKKKKGNNGDLIINNINNYNGFNYFGNKGLVNIIYSSNNNDNANKGNYNNYYTNLSMKKKNKKKKTNSCEFIDEINNIENLLNKGKNKNRNKNKDTKMVNLTSDNWKELCDKIYNKTKKTLEKYNNYLNIQIGNNNNLVQK